MANSNINDWEEVDDWEEVTPTRAEKATKAISDTASSIGEGATSLADSALETAGAFGAGMAQGGTLGFAEEAGAGAQTLLDRIGFGYEPEVPANLEGIETGSPIDIDKQLSEQGFEGELTPDAGSFYRTAQKEEEKRHEELQEESPWAYGGGQLAGGLATATGIGGAAQLGRVGKAANVAGQRLMASPVSKVGKLFEIGARTGTTAGIGAGTGAVLGAGESEGGIIGATEEEKEELQQDVESGALVGGALGGTLQGLQDVGSAALKGSTKYLVGKANELIDQDDSAKAFREVFRSGVKKIKSLPRSSEKLIKQGKGKTLHEEANTATKEVYDKILEADTKLSARVGHVIENAHDELDVSPTLKAIRDAADQVEMDYDTDPLLTKYYDKVGAYLKSDDGVFQPLNVKQVDKLIKDIKIIRNKYQAKQGYVYDDTTKAMNDGIDMLLEELRNGVPEYKVASNQLREYRKNVVEKFLYPTAPEGVPYKTFSQMGDKKKSNLYEGVKGITSLFEADKKLGYPQDAGRDIIAKVLGDITGELDPAKQKEILRNSRIFQDALGMSGEEFKDLIKNAATKSHADVITRKRTALNPWRSTVGGSLKEDIVMGGSGKEFFGKSLGNIGEVVGSGAGKKMAEMPFQMTGIKGVAEMLTTQPDTVVSKLVSNPVTRKYGEMLSKGLQEQNQPLINSALYLLNRDDAALKALGGE